MQLYIYTSSFDDFVHSILSECGEIFMVNADRAKLVT